MPRGDNPRKDSTGFTHKQRRKKALRPEITPDMYQECYHLYNNNNYTYRDCIQHLKENYNLDVSIKTFAASFKKYRDNRAEINKKAYFKKAQETAARDFQHLDTLIENCMVDYLSAREQNDLRLALQIVDRIKVLIETRRKFNLGLSENNLTVNINNTIQEKDIKLDLAKKLGLPDEEIKYLN